MMNRVNAESGKGAVTADSFATVPPNVSISELTGKSSGSADGGWKSALVREIRSHSFGYGGLALGVCSALCAAPQKFM